MKKLLTLLCFISLQTLANQTTTYELELAKIYEKQFVKPMAKKIPLMMKKLKALVAEGDSLSKAKTKERDSLILQLKRYQYASKVVKLSQKIHLVASQQATGNRSQQAELRNLAKENIRLFSEYSEIASEKEFQKARSDARTAYVKEKRKTAEEFYSLQTED